jgi:hypothetical protein
MSRPVIAKLAGIGSGTGTVAQRPVHDDNTYLDGRVEVDSPGDESYSVPSILTIRPRLLHAPRCVHRDTQFVPILFGIENVFLQTR